MNNNLNDLYGLNNSSNDNSQNTEIDNQTNLSKLYGNKTQQIKEPEKVTGIIEDNNIYVDQEGVSKLYNQKMQLIEDDISTNTKENNPSNVYSKINNQETNTNQTIIQVSDDDLLKAYIGKNFITIATHPFNFWAFIFNYFYLFYRKNILLGILLYVLLLLLSTVMNAYIGFIGLAILIGASFNQLYINKAKRFISQEKINNTSYEDITNNCIKKGGVSYISLIIGISIAAFITFIFFILVNIFNLKLHY